MYAGRIVEHAPAEELFRTPRHPYTEGLLSSFPSLHGERRVMTGIPGSPPDLRHLPTGCPFHPRCAHALDACAELVPQLLPIHWEPNQPRRASCLLHTDGFQPPASLTKTSLRAEEIGSTR
jgi:peptide/nickel transport system ATP-binding protein